MKTAINMHDYKLALANKNTPLTLQARHVLDVIEANTLCLQKPEARLSNSVIAGETNMTEGNVSKNLKVLRDCGVVSSWNSPAPILSASQKVRVFSFLVVVISLDEALEATSLWKRKETGGRLELP